MSRCADCDVSFIDMKKCKNCHKNICNNCINLSGYVGPKYVYDLGLCDYCFASYIEERTKL